VRQNKFYSHHVQRFHFVADTLMPVSVAKTHSVPGITERQ